MTKMTIEWLSAAPAKNLQELEESNLASVRLRTAIGIKAAHELGIRNVLSDGRSSGAAQLSVVGKVDYVSDPARPARWLQRLRQLKASGTRVIVDYTDHHLAAQSPAADFYRDALSQADTILTSSLKLCEHVLTHTGRQAVMIDDPIEVLLQPPVAREHQLKTMLWFGHASNLPYLFEFLLNRYRSTMEYRLIVMTNLHSLPDHYLQALNAPHLQQLEINVIPWSIKDMLTAASLSDLCIIPAGVADPRKSGASANRLLTALALGLPTAADMLDSYAPMNAYFTDLRKADLDRMLDEPERWFPEVQGAQQLIAREHTKAAAQQRWRQLIGQKEHATA
jgi:hypothetical protein